MFSKILVACDGSLQSEKALITAIDGCMKEDSELHIVHIMNINTFSAIDTETSYGGAESPHDISRKFLEKGRDETVNMIDRVCSEKNVIYTLHVDGGSPGHAIIDLASKIGADLIVIGSTGKGLAGRLIIGSVSGYISAHSRISTMIVR
ncbi:MAG: universal stress protein [Methanomicrobiaceae archaeon]|nr:universal stress protein [Methanomicrobiaceae archaeon]